MLPNKMNLLVLVLVIFLKSNQSFGVREEGHLIQKRMELESCIVRFDVHEDTIIRTEESRAIGAKFLDYADLGSREECLRLCCETDGCDVFVFEEKSQGTCFLFKCGPPENFRCKFTKHTNYSSAVLTPLRHVVPPPTQPTQIRVINVGLSQHEMELKNLRDGKQTGREKTTTLIPPLGVRIMPSEKITTKPPFAAASSSKCGRFEFPCHSGECIAVYNVCDGIPQCEDGSDEGPECPTTSASNTKSPTNSIQAATHLGTFNSNTSSTNNNSSSSSSSSNNNDAVTYEKNPNSNNLQTAYTNLNNEVDRIQQAQLQNGQLLSRNLMPPMIVNGNTQISEHKPVDLQNGPQSGVVYHEKLSRNREDPITVPQWPGMHQQNNGQYYEPDSHIFNHKGGLQVSTNNLPSQYGPGSIYDNSNYLPISRENSMSVQETYRNMLSNQQGWLPDRRMPQNMDWPPQQLLPQQMYDNTIPVNQQQQQQQQQQSVIGLLPPELPPKQQMMQQPTMLKPDWQIRPNPPLKSHDVIPQFPAPEKINKPANSNAAKSDQQSSSGEESDDDSDYDVDDVKTTEAPKKKPKKHKTKSKTKEQDDTEVASISVKEIKPHAVKSNERIDHPVHEQLKLIKTDLEIEFADHDGPAERPGGAVLSLTLGVIITATLAVLVGCRMRAVGRRIRRTGKSSYAHEADFLVNGMYL